MFIKTGDAQPISFVYEPADVDNKSTKKQLEKTIEEVKKVEDAKESK